MAAQPLKSGSATERAEAQPARAPTPVAARELTLRAVLFGCAVGVLLAAGNVYTGLKTGFIDGGGITAALLGFAFFSTFNGLGRGPFGKLENNVSQTTASSAAIMGFAIGLPGAIPALQLLGHTYPGWALVVWGVGVGGVGIFVAVVLRRKLVVNEALPFPTGAATAEVIETISTSRSTALFRARMLVVAALVAMAVTWFRDGRPSPIPQTTAFGGAVLGVSLASLSVGVSWSPLLVSTGVLMGVRSAFSMLLGGFTFWVCIAPWLVRSQIVPGPGYSQDLPWITWPAVGLLLSSSFVPLVMEWRGLARSFRDIPMLLRRRREAVDDGLAAADRFRLARPLLLVSVLLILVVARLLFDLPLLATAFGLLIALVLANVCARTTGETDMAPTGVLGTLTQVTFGGTGFVTSLFTGSITSGVGAQTAQTLWAFRAGNQLRASPRAQVWAEILGAVLGAIVSVPVYMVIVKAYGLGTVAMPSPSAISWKATAQAVIGGLSAMPRYAGVAGLVGFGVGVVLSTLARGRWGRFVPSAAAMGMAALSPFSLSFSVFLGGLLLLVYGRLRPAAESGHTLMSVAAGGIAGESIMAVIIAILIATGAL